MPDTPLVYLLYAEGDDSDYLVGVYGSEATAEAAKAEYVRRHSYYPGDYTSPTLAWVDAVRLDDPANLPPGAFVATVQQGPKARYTRVAWKDGATPTSPAEVSRRPFAWLPQPLAVGYGATPEEAQAAAEALARGLPDA